MSPNEQALTQMAMKHVASTASSVERIAPSPPSELRIMKPIAVLHVSFGCTCAVCGDANVS